MKTDTLYIFEYYSIYIDNTILNIDSYVNAYCLGYEHTYIGQYGSSFGKINTISLKDFNSMIGCITWSYTRNLDVIA